MSVFCVHCATENDHQGKFCLSCGLPLVRRAQNTHSVSSRYETACTTDAQQYDSLPGKLREEIPRIPSGARIVLPLSSIPVATKKRVSRILETDVRDVIVLRTGSQTKRLIVIAASVATIIGALTYTQQYRWAENERLSIFLVQILAFVAGAISTERMIRYKRARFRDVILINPFYVICLSGNQLIAYPLSSLKSPDLTDEKSYLPSSMALTLTFEDGSVSYTPATPLQRKQLMQALNGFRCFREELSDHDFGAIYNFDLLYEARELAHRYDGKKNLRGFVSKTEWAIAFLALLAAVACGFLADDMNDKADDDLRWASAMTANNVSAFRLYLALRSTGEHRTEARHQIDRIYQEASVRYAAQAGESSQGVEAVLAIINYARATDHYRVAVTFTGTNQIPEAIEDQLKRRWGVAEVVSTGSSFEETSNKERELKILQRIKTSFEKVIPGDVLAFETGTSDAGDVDFDVEYTLGPTGSIYYSESEERITDSKRHYYVGVGYNWRFDVRVPGRESLYELNFTSAPASLFRVAYRRVSQSASGENANPAEVYAAMAESAFGDFSTKLLAEIGPK